MLTIGDRVVDIKNINNLQQDEIQNKAGIITAINNERASVDFNGQITEFPVFELIKLSLVIKNN